MVSITSDTCRSYIAVSFTGHYFAQHGIQRAVTRPQHKITKTMTCGSGYVQEAKQAIVEAAKTPYAKRSGDYMASLALVHCKERGWLNPVIA